MPTASKKKHPGRNQRTAIEPDVRFADKAGPHDLSDADTAVTEEESKLAEEFPDGGDCPGRKY